eukprot:g1381.t1
MWKGLVEQSKTLKKVNKLEREKKEKALHMKIIIFVLFMNSFALVVAILGGSNIIDPLVAEWSTNIVMALVLLFLGCIGSPYYGYQVGKIIKSAKSRKVKALLGNIHFVAWSMAALCWFGMAVFIFTIIMGTVKSTTQERKSSAHNNWAVLVDTSTFYFNYRHASNTLALYHTIRRLGIPDSNIILMLGDDAACNPRNPYRGTVFSDSDHTFDLYGSDVEVDYSGSSVTVTTLLNLLTGRHEPGSPASKRLDSDANSNILIYLTGHGGDEFLKFRDAEIISGQDLDAAFLEMQNQQRYRKILFIADTCQAATLQTTFTASNVLAIASSRKGQNSYSYGTDYQLAVPVIDRFTKFSHEFFHKKYKINTGKGRRSIEKASLWEFINWFNDKALMSSIAVRTDLVDWFGKNVGHETILRKTKLIDFFGTATHQSAKHKIFDTSLEPYLSSIPDISLDKGLDKGLEERPRDGLAKGLEDGADFVTNSLLTKDAIIALSSHGETHDDSLFVYLVTLPRLLPGYALVSRLLTFGIVIILALTIGSVLLLNTSNHGVVRLRNKKTKIQ